MMMDIKEQLNECGYYLNVSITYLITVHFIGGCVVKFQNHQSIKQIIYASDNFVNQDGYVKEWKKF